MLGRCSMHVSVAALRDFDPANDPVGSTATVPTGDWGTHNWFTCCSVVDVTGATLPHPGCAAVVPNRLWDYML